MPKITFTCETITPMFLTGADGETPELRAPSIKGALRFWWRALNGHLVTSETEGIKNLLTEDEKLFGGTSSDTRKSNVLVRVLFKEDNITLINIDTIKRRSESGVKYLFYSLTELQEGREGLDTKNQFKIILSSKNKNDLLKACASFWIVSNLGGFGSRARRGGGGISIRAIGGDIDIITKSNLVFNLSPASNLVLNFKKNTEIIKTLLDTKKIHSQIQKYSLFDTKKVYFSKTTFTTWDKALNNIGSIMISYRKGKGAKKREERTFTMDTLNQKAAFGLPIRVQNDTELNFKELYNRRSSPIWITVIKNLEGKFHWVVTHLQGGFMPPNTSLYFKSKNPNLSYVEEGTSEIKREYPFEKEDDKLLLKFIETVKEHSNYIKA